MKEKSPAFQFYPKEFLSSTKVIAMSLTERGAYITLLSAEWLDGSLPTDHRLLAAIVGLTEQRFSRMWPRVLARCFVEKDGRLFNERLERARRERSDYIASATKGGKRSVEVRREKHGSAQPKSTSTALRSDARSAPEVPAEVTPNTASASPSASASATPDKVKESTPPPFDRWLIQLQEDYPQNRVTYGFMTSSGFFDVFQKDPRPPAEVWAEMRNNLENHKASHEWRVKGMAPKLEKWLLDGLWKQRHEAEPPAKETAKPSRYANWRPR